MQPRQLLIVVLTLGLVTVGFLRPSNRPAPSTSSTPLANLTAANYFPPSAAVTQTNGGMLCDALKSCQERPLFERAGNGEAYRFILWNSKGTPICIALYCNPIAAQSAVITKSQITPKSDSEKRLCTQEVTHGEAAVDAVQSATLLKCFAEEKFWKIDRFDECTSPPLYDFKLFGRSYYYKPGGTMKDGEYWIVEGIKDGQYRIVQRESPDDDDATTRLGRMLLKQAKIFRRGDREIY